jgi:hypothetical protein
VTYLVTLEVGTSPDPNVYAQAYARITADVLGELGLIGAIVAFIAMIPAAFMRGGQNAGPGVMDLEGDRVEEPVLSAER